MPPRELAITAARGRIVAQVPVELGPFLSFAVIGVALALHPVPIDSGDKRQNPHGDGREHPNDDNDSHASASPVSLMHSSRQYSASRW